jgi:hypothetical protein
MRRTVGLPPGRLQQLTDRPVHGDRVVPGDDRAEPDLTVVTGEEETSQVALRLDARLLYVVEAVLVRLPTIDLCAVRAVTLPATRHRARFPSRAMSSPSPRGGDSTTWNGPSTVDWSRGAAFHPF